MEDTLFTEKHCAICNKVIVTSYSKVWKYKAKENVSSAYIWYCSWSCYRKAGGVNGTIKSKRRTKQSSKRFDMQKMSSKTKGH